MSPDARRDFTKFSSHLICMLLAMLSSAAFATVEIDRAASVWGVRGMFAFECVATLLLGWYLRRVAMRLSVQPAVSPILVMVFLGSLLFEPFSRMVLGTGRPFEMLLGFSLKNTVLAMSAAGCWRNYQQLAVTASLFVQMFALTLLPNHVWPITLGYALIALWWLMNSHWEQVSKRLGNVHGGTGQTVPRSVIYVVLGICVAVAATELLTDRAMTRQLSGILPSSGGTGEHDPYARDGVGDGDALVAGSENIQSFAPIEEAPFKSSDEPSLYDVYSDVYEEPVKVKNQNRAIALPNQQMEDLCCRMAKSEMAGREFSTVRQPSKSRAGQMKDLKSEALFYVAGRTPLHLRQELFDLYDGTMWYPEDGEKIASRLVVEQVNERPWITLSTTGMAYNNYDIFAAKESHALKIAHLGTNVIPAPNRLLAVHIDQMDDLSLIKEVQHGLLALEGKRIPAMLPVHLSSRVLDTRRVDEQVRSFPPVTASRKLPEDPQFERVRELADAWSQGIPKGTAQIAKIIQELQARCALDRMAKASEESNCTVSDFLFEKRSGPDYQFASATAILLRSLGYGTRVVSGYYVNPDKYDRISRHTPVHKEDLHFWVEVYLGANLWMTVEPTPGYVVLGPPPTVWEQAWAVAASGVNWISQHRWGVLAILLICVALVVTRLWWMDAARTLEWRTRRSRLSTQRVIAAQRILELRFSAIGAPRRSCQTFHQWARQHSFLNEDEANELLVFARVVETAHYAMLEGLPDRERLDAQFHAVSQRALCCFTLKRLRAARRLQRKATLDSSAAVTA
ncbi:transglutaminase-like domain-containing protein [Lacunimicrobium album]